MDRLRAHSALNSLYPPHSARHIASTQRTVCTNRAGRIYWPDFTGGWIWAHPATILFLGAGGKLPIFCEIGGPLSAPLPDRASRR